MCSKKVQESRVQLLAKKKHKEKNPGFDATSLQEIWEAQKQIGNVRKRNKRNKHTKRKWHKNMKVY